MDGQETEHTLHSCVTVIMYRRVLSLVLCMILFHAPSDAAAPSSRLPTYILMSTVIVVDKPPVRLTILSVRWEHDGRPLVDYKEGNMTNHNPRALMPLEQIKDGNISLVLTNLTLSDSGNYTCVIHYGAQRETARYTLIVEKHRIQLFNLAPDPKMTDLSQGQQTGKPKDGVPYLHIVGNPNIKARLGDDVLLPCIFKTEDPLELGRLTTQWSKDGVTKWFSNKTCCVRKEPYISEQDILRGHVSLQLTNVQREDNGVYTCYIKYKSLAKSLDTVLQVEAPTSTTKRTTTSQGETQASTTSKSPFEQRPAQKFRTLKIGLVVGAVAATGFLAVFIFFCFPG
ncbi:uncharacterized protein LOC142097305 isoform X2 [Mixophyes fleayi]|uniref:uncharacterized protein LOC142097305 isoform X2 n=1 Tax=Mixophyes fleayi TaxID=3061075 RepID=UPI003F4E0D88